jgi:hypothetical protein
MNYALEIRHVGETVLLKIFSITGVSPTEPEEEQKILLALDDVRDTTLAISPTYAGVLDLFDASEVTPGFEIVSGGREGLADALAAHFKNLPQEEAREVAQGAIITLFDEEPD